MVLLQILGPFFLAGLLPVIIIAGILAAIIYLIIKRIDDSNNENFEKRDN